MSGGNERINTLNTANKRDRKQQKNKLKKATSKEKGRMEVEVMWLYFSENVGAASV